MEKIKIEINPEFKAYSGQITAVLHRIIDGKFRSLSAGDSADYLPDGAEYIYRGRNSLYRFQMGETPVIVKDFKRPHILNRYVYTNLRKSKARRSFENALKIAGLGFLTPQPVAYCEVKRGLQLIWSFYLSVQLDGATEMRRWEENPDRETLLPAFAADMLRLHRAGVWHKDFSPGNILYKKDSAGNYNFYYVDLNRMQFDVTDKRKLMRMFRSINLNREEAQRLGRLYARAAGLDEDEIAAEALRQLEGYFAEQKRKKMF